MSKLPRAFLEILIIFIIVILMSLLIINVNDTSKIFALLGVFGVSAIKILPHLNTILNSLNSFKFSKETVEFYNRNIKNQKISIQSEKFKKLNFTIVLFLRTYFLNIQIKKNMYYKM